MLRPMRLFASLLLLFSLAALALWYHESLGKSHRSDAQVQLQQDPLRDDTERRVLLTVGGENPPLVLEPRPQAAQPGNQGERPGGESSRERPPRRSNPRPGPRQDSGPRPLAPPRSADFDSRVLGNGQTIYELVVDHYGSPRRLQEVLRANQLDEEKAKRLQPGTAIRLPR